MSQQQQQDQKLKSSGLRKVGFAAVATSMLSIAFSATQPLFLQANNSYEAIPEKRQYVVSKFEELQNVNEELTKISDVNFSPDGQTLASASYDGTVKLWNVATGKNLKILEGHSDKVNSVIFSPDGKTIASASADKTIKIWSQDGTLKKVLQGYDAEVTNVSFCPDNQVIVSSNADNTISLWNVNGSLVKTLTVGNSIRNVNCSPDSNIIAVTSHDNIVRLWNRNGQEINRQELQTSNFSSLGSRGKIYFVPHHKNGDVIGTATSGQGNGGNININTKSLILENGDVIDTATSGQGNGGNININTKSLILENGDVIGTATSGQGNGGNININTKSLILENGDVIGTATSGQGNGGNISINISDRISVDAVGNDVISNYKSSSVESHSVKIAGEINFNVRSLLDRKIASRIEYKTVSLNNRDRLVFVNYKDNLNNADQTISSNDNSIVASISGGNTVLLSKNGSSLSLKLNNSVSAIALHPNNKILASGCDDGTIYFWNVNTGKLIRSLKVHESKVNKVNYSPDGRRITSASDDGIVKVWYPDSSSSNPGFIIVIVSLISVFSGIIVLFVVTKRRQSKQHNNTSNTQTSYIITGWVVCVIPEDWRSDLEALRYELITAKNPTWYVRFITVTTLVDMLFGGIRVKLHNFYYGNNFMAVPGRPSITDKKDNSVNHND